MLQISSESSSQNRSSSTQPTTSRKASNSNQERVASSHHARRAQSPNESDSNEIQINKLLDDARNGVFNRVKIAIIEDKKEKSTTYCEIYNWFKFEKKIDFDTNPDKKLEFKCIVCNFKTNLRLGRN